MPTTPVIIEPVTLAQLTEAKVDGAGVFDTLMRATGAHCKQEYDRDRIKGQDYAQVYLTGLQYTLQTAVQFLMGKDKAYLDAQLVEVNIRLAEKQLELAEEQLKQEAQKLELLKAQSKLALAQAAQVEAETLNVPKQGVLLDAQSAQVNAETLNVPKQGQLLDAQVAQATKQGQLIDQQIAKSIQETTNLVQELANMKAQECLLKSQYDLTMVQKLQTTAQTSLVNQKIATEKAQTVEIGVDDNSVIGRQKALYKAQTDGFSRDAEQKAAKALIDTWNVRRTTDEGTVADATNMLNDATIGRVVLKMLDGVKA